MKTLHRCSGEEECQYPEHYQIWIIFEKITAGRMCDNVPIMWLVQAGVIDPGE